MIHKVSTWIANYSLQKAWIDKDELDWCRYALERKFRTGIFIVFSSIICLILGCIIEACFFTIVNYGIRRRMGGWHFESPLLCQVFSILLVCSNAAWIGHIVERVPQNILALLAFFMTIILYNARPVYSQKLHFTQEVSFENNNKKNQFLIVLTLVQIVLWLYCQRMIVYTFLGLLTAYLSIQAEAFSLLKGGEDVETCRKYLQKDSSGKHI
jgi:accessory gene regulator protein AgrB